MARTHAAIVEMAANPIGTEQWHDVEQGTKPEAEPSRANLPTLRAELMRRPVSRRVLLLGGVVRPGEEILQIIPLDEELFVEARVKPEDIAGVRPGQEATVKLSAYDYTIYGTLKGTVGRLETKA